MKRPHDDAVGRRALFTHAEAGTGRTPAAGEGRHALFSAPARRGAVIQCGSCRAATPVGWRWLWSTLTPSWHVPFRSFPIRMRCPACRRFSWCRVGWEVRPAR